MPDPDAARIARLGAVLASESRASILAALLSGTAHTHTELARFLGRSVSSVSEHVGVLVDAGLVRVEPQGRHRYVRLADAGVADLLERLSTRIPIRWSRSRGCPASSRSRARATATWPARSASGCSTR